MFKKAIMPAKDGAKDGAKAARLLWQLLIYAIFVFAYYFLVLHFLGGWLKRLFDDHKAAYALVAVALITGQGFLLELLTGWLFTTIRGKTK
jgi:Kef-type K+ transport system membrane component KefB